MPSSPTSAQPVPVEHDDPVNARILAVSEDSIQGFVRDPLDQIAAQSEVELPVVIERIRAMLDAGVIRRVRQTLMANKLAEGALVAWSVDDTELDQTFDFMFQKDPFSGHVVVRSTDRKVSGSEYKLWTTVKVPHGESIDYHCTVLKKLTGAHDFLLMPAKGIFTLGVGHTRRKSLEPGAMIDEPATMMTTDIVPLSEDEWKIVIALKREFSAAELTESLWAPRAAEAGVSLDEFCNVAESLNARGVVGRFSTFLEHVKPSQTGKRVTRFNALFHWAVPKGREQEAGGEVGRHHCMTHAYWREGGPQFGNVNIMGVIHGTDKTRVLEHKAAIDKHLESCGIPVSYTNVFWGGRSEIKPSEISPYIYRAWHAENKAAEA
ncbi:MAG: Lrp/AsnC family transcriptional regulator [Verrucomicrobiota bacterium]